MKIFHVDSQAISDFIKSGAFIIIFLIIHCLTPLYISAEDTLPKDAHPETKAANKAMYEVLDFDDRQDFEDSRRGFIATLDPMVIMDKDQNVVWDMTAYDFISDIAPETVNPSLWRQEQLNNIHGLFKIHDRIYMVRNFDLANMIIVAGDTGWIVIDTLTTAETSRAAMKLVAEHLGDRQVKAVIYTHTHADHFGGVRGVVDEADVKAGKVRIIAPEGFMEYAIAENVLAGNAMSRRAHYQFGMRLDPSPKGHVGSGLGKGVPKGTIGLIPPTETVKETGEELTVDGVRLVFQMACGSEAPAEYMFYFPDFKALCLAEVTTRHMHNIHAIRGAQVRDSLLWSKYINETLDLFGKKAELAFGVHHWPVWGNARIQDYLVKQRDLYRFIHDETLRLANKGLTPREIAETMSLPPSLEKEFHARGYYGTLIHNVKAVYQFYLGWFDGNPASLNPLPPTESAKRYVQYMGGAGALLEKARKEYEKGDFRWVAEVVNHLVFAEPDNREAKLLQAAALEQMGYQAESGVWRNAYLSAAAELRHGLKAVRVASTTGSDVMRAMTLDMIFDFIGIRLKKDQVANANMNINIEFTNIKTNYALELSNSVLNNTKGRLLEKADATYKLSTAAFARLLNQQATLPELIESGEVTVVGNPKAIGAILHNLEQFNPLFNIVAP